MFGNYLPAAEATVDRAEMSREGFGANRRERVSDLACLSSTLYVFDQVQVQKRLLFAMWLRA